MSGILNFAARFGAEVVLTQVSSGALTMLYDPAIFLDDGTALRQFIVDNSYGQTSSSPRLSPWYQGLVVFDFDEKRVLDCQEARRIRCLSMRIDHSWLHFRDWHENQWLVDGLVNPVTGEVVKKFPEEPEFPDFDWYEKVVDAHLDVVPNRNAAGQLVVTAARLAQYATAPRFAIRPPGWRFDSYARMDCVQMREQLGARGFDVDEADLPLWSAWRDEP
jgi:hypothetical protein